jgi:hypothetical protein
VVNSKRNRMSLSARELVSGDRRLMKVLMKEAPQEVLEAEMTEHHNPESIDYLINPYEQLDAHN